MKLTFSSKVCGPFEQVFAAFDQALFTYLLPPGTRLLRFDGSRTGDVVHIRFPLKTEWVSVITEVKKYPDRCFFVDEGTQLPFGLRFWNHTHIVHKDGSNSIIEDIINFSTGSKALDTLVYPVLYAAFLPRDKKYKQYFNRLLRDGN